MAARVVLFLDYNNAFNSAREVFHKDHRPRWAGQVDPLKLGELVASRGLQARELAEVRVYRGRPDSGRDPKTYMGHMRQCQAQTRAGRGKVSVITRTLRYPPDWPSARAQEKGIDVALAIDFVQTAMLGGFDVGVIMSTDTDLKPALEAVLRLRPQGGPTCEVAAWSKAGCHCPRLSIPCAKIWCHWLSECDYLSVVDRTDYNMGPG